MNPVQNQETAPSRINDPGLEVLLTAVFNAWRASGLEFLVLRNYEALPASTTNDVDVLVARRDLVKAEAILISTARRSGYLLHNRVEFATNSYFLHHPGSRRQIQIDLFFSLKWHTFELMTTSEVLAHRVDRGLFAVPDPVHEAVLDLLSRLIYSGVVKEKYRPIILAGFRSDPACATNILANCFGEALAHTIVEKALEQNWPAVEQLWRPLQRQLIIRRCAREPMRTAAGIAADLLRGVKRLVHPAGAIVVLLGPDGSGKSTVGELLSQNLANTFNPGKNLWVHWKPVVFFRSGRRRTTGPNTDPHGREPRGRLLSLLYLGFHWLEFVAGSHLGFLKPLFRNGMVLIDRYHYDFLVDQRRYRLQVPNWTVRLLFRAAKKPDLVLLLNAPAGVLQARKREVPAQESERQVRAYREVVTALKQGVVLDATQTPEAVATQATDAVLKYLRRRTVRRGWE